MIMTMSSMTISLMLMILMTVMSMLMFLHSAKGGAVETGCSGLHSIIGCFTM